MKTDMAISIRNLYIAAVAVLGLTVLSPSALVAQTAATAPHETTLAGLRARLDAQMNAPRFSGAEWSVKVTSLETGKTLYENHPDRLLSPASNSKLYTAALALDTLGGDYCFTTPIFATAKVDDTGTVAGDLIISGRGDPSWKAAHFMDIFNPFVAALTNAGVKVVTGDLVADASFFHGRASGGSWCVEDLDDSDGAGISALTLADNTAEIRVTPGATTSDPCQFTLDPADTVLHLVNLTKTIPAGGRAHLDMEAATGTNDLYIIGEMPADGAAVTLDAPVEHPERWFGVALKEALAAQGIVVKGGVRVVTWPGKPSWNQSALVKLGEVKSPPLRDILRAFLKPSQNLETDLVFRHVGELTREPNTPDWVTSEDLAVHALDRFLARQGIPRDVHFDEGSGLSRNNLTSARATVALLATMAASRGANDYFAGLPIAGVDGTLRNRMKKTPAYNNVHAKTGTLRWANSLSGYLTTAAGEKLAFSLMLNRYAAPPDRSRTGELDVIAVLLAGFTGRSDE
jgi:D-alanyl-D-alanine carboxypeptidase/D-alanyl-D-alanine-endopeptidase (penicillin-binding protein 4)